VVKTLASKVFKTAIVFSVSAPLPLTELGKSSLNQAYAHLYLWNRGLEGLISYLEVVNNEGKELVIFIQDHYKLNR